MARPPQSQAEEFTAGWQTAAAWADSQGISAASYLPVYQLDLNRLQNGEYTMSAAERNLAILAADNPNAVISAPSDNPQPSNVWGNSIRDVGMIATGILHMPQELWDLSKNTFKAVENPASLHAKTPGGTVGNWLSDTLLSLFPGAADVGQVLQVDPTLTGNAGFKRLAENPLTSLLDLLPGGEGLLGRIAPEAADAANVALAQAIHDALPDALKSKLPGFSRPGVTMAGEAGTLSLGQRIANLIGNSPVALGGVTGDVAEAWNTVGRLGANMYAWLMEPANSALSDLSDADMAQLAQILDTERTTGGNSVREALARGSAVPLQVQEALRAMLDGPLRFAEDEELLRGGIRATPTLDGRIGTYAERGARSVFRARAAKLDAERDFAESLSDAETIKARYQYLDAKLDEGLKRFQPTVTAARRAVADDPELVRNVTRELEGGSRWRRSRGISKAAQVQAVVGEGGLADQFIENAGRTRDPDAIGAAADAMRRRLSAWGPRSVAAADVPALAGLYSLVERFGDWADLAKRLRDELDEMIQGKASEARIRLSDAKAFEKLRRSGLRRVHVREGENLLAGYRRGVEQLRSDYAGSINRTREATASYIAMRETRGDVETANLTDRVARPVVDKALWDIRDAQRQAKVEIKVWGQKFLEAKKQRWTEYQRDRALMTRRQDAETSALLKELRERRAPVGRLVRDMTAYAKTLDDYERAVYEHPADEYRDAFMLLWERHLMEHTKAALLKFHTEAYMRDRAGLADAEIDRILSDPRLLGEYMIVRFRDIFDRGDLDPEIAADAGRAMREARRSAIDEINTLAAQGLELHYIPASAPFDERLGHYSIQPHVGKGVPVPDMAKNRVWQMTARTGEAMVGINKAVVQALQRDAVIDLAEHTLKPMTMRWEDFTNFVDQIEPFAGSGGNRLAHYEQVAARMKLRTWDPKALFGFSLPRWGGDRLLLHEGIVKELEKLSQAQKRTLLAGTNKVFRYSILGLSPRYDAHVIFGGAMMAALRTSPFDLRFLSDAYRNLRDGALPEQLIRHHNVEEGLDDNAVISLRNQAAGRDMGRMMAAEHVERVQGIAAAAAKPVHWLKAVADLNFAFTRYVRDLQASYLYTSASSKAAARVSVFDAEVGHDVEMTPARAMAEGMAATRRVYGNLDRMSPFERSVAQSVMPFYGWQKHILGYVMTFPFDHPYRALVLSQLAYNASASVPLAYPVRIQLLMFLGSPDGAGNMNAVDLRTLDPFRDIANYATWGASSRRSTPPSWPPSPCSSPPSSTARTSCTPTSPTTPFTAPRRPAPRGTWPRGCPSSCPSSRASPRHSRGCPRRTRSGTPTARRPSSSCSPTSTSPSSPRRSTSSRWRPRQPTPATRLPRTSPTTPSRPGTSRASPATPRCRTPSTPTTRSPRRPSWPSTASPRRPSPASPRSPPSCRRPRRRGTDQPVDIVYGVYLCGHGTRHGRTPGRVRSCRCRSACTPTCSPSSTWRWPGAGPTSAPGPRRCKTPWPSG